MRTVPCRERETDRTYRDPRGVGQKIRGRTLELNGQQQRNEEVTQEKKVGVEWGPGGFKVTRPEGLQLDRAASWLTQRGRRHSLHHLCYRTPGKQRLAPPQIDSTTSDFKVGRISRPIVRRDNVHQGSLRIEAARGEQSAQPQVKVDPVT